MDKTKLIKAFGAHLKRAMKRPDWGGDNFPLVESLPAEFNLAGALALMEDGEPPFFPAMIIHDGEKFWISHEGGWFPYTIHDENPGYPTIGE